MTEIVLPTKIVERETDNPKRLIIVGKPKVGKTTLISRLPNCLIIDLDDGTRNVDALKIKAESLSQLRDICKEIHKSEHKYDYLAIDTITKLEEWCEDEATEYYMSSSIGQKFNRDIHGNLLPKRDWESVLTLPNGGGYYYLRIVFKRWLAVFDKLSENIILVAHIKDKFINEIGKEVAVNAIDLTGKLAGIVSASACAIGFLFVDKKTSDLMITFDSKLIEGGTRINHLKGQTFPIMTFEKKGEQYFINQVHWDKIYTS